MDVLLSDVNSFELERLTLDKPCVIMRRELMIIRSSVIGKKMKIEKNYEKLLSLNYNGDSNSKKNVKDKKNLWCFC